jgi:GxxExxY protein
MNNKEQILLKLDRAKKLSSEVIAAAIEVHRHKGPGLVESIYEKCLLYELNLRHIPAIQQMRVPIEYKGVVFEEELRLDLLIDSCMILELKVVENLLPVHTAQLLSYMKLLQIPVGYLMNFHEPLLKNGIRRVTLKECLPQKTTSMNSMISL